MSQEVFDVAVIGAGVVGAAIARELSRYDLHCVLIEAANDVGAGTSKANTAILHTGFDTAPGSLEARLVSRGHDLLSEYAREVGIPHEHTGALLVAWNRSDLAQLDEVESKATQNGYMRTRRLSVEQLYRDEPNLGPGALGGVEIPDEGIICPFTTPLAYATQAVINGVTLKLNFRVTRVASGPGDIHELHASNDVIAARYVVNAAGLHADQIDRLFGNDTFSVKPRRGQLIVFDKFSRRLISRIILPVPSKTTKGVLVAPTVFGNVLLGPTAEDIEDKDATCTTEDGLESLRVKGKTIVPALLDEEVTATYAGLRAATEHGDYQIRGYPERRYVCVGGIRSTGLTSSLAIAEYVLGLLEAAALKLPPKRQFSTVKMPMIGEIGLRPYQDAEAISRNPDYGRIVCHCERVTLGEIIDACEAAVPARDLDGLRRRTRAQLGRCQTFYCGARVVDILAHYCGRPAAELMQLDECATGCPS